MNLDNDDLAIEDSDHEQNTEIVDEEWKPVTIPENEELSLKNDNLYPCDQCEYIAIGNKQNLKRHKESIHEGIRYSCDLCGSAFTKPSALTRHRKLKHEGIIYQCDQCEYKGASLYRHIRTTHKGVRYPCDQCEHASTTKQGLTKHKKAKHYSSLQCDQCEYTAIELSGLKQHKKTEHEENRLPCDQCDYSATTRQNLGKHHASKHEGIRYPCELCDYLATQPSSLKLHIKTKHTVLIDNIKADYPCDQCNYSAKTKQNLGKHKASKHEGIRYPCELCDYLATQPCSLKVHIKTKHNVMIDKIKVDHQVIAGKPIFIETSLFDGEEEADISEVDPLADTNQNGMIDNELVIVKEEPENYEYDLEPNIEITQMT